MARDLARDSEAESAPQDHDLEDNFLVPGVALPWPGARVHRRNWLWVSGATAAAIAVGAVLRSSSERSVVHWSSESLEIKATEAVTRTCGAVQDHNINYRCPSLDYDVADVSDPEACCSICERDFRCGAWSWTSSRMCFLKAWDGKGAPEKSYNPGMTSGLPPRSQPGGGRGTATTSGRSTTTTKTTATLARTSHGKKVDLHEVAHPMPEASNRGASLFCFLLTAPHGREMMLVRLQEQHHAGIFVCDGYTVFSNATIKVAAGVDTNAVKIDLHVPKGGPSKTPLNLNIFIAVWWKLITDGHFLRHDWTVKVDPDTVFVPARLRSLLRGHTEGPHGTYVNNCKHGMLGALEVFSTKAVTTWGASSALCLQHFQMQCHGPCPWGEDKFIDQCMWSVLRVKRENVSGVLVDGRCDPPQDWMTCSSASGAAFHPFSDVGAFTQCLAATAR